MRDRHHVTISLGVKRGGRIGVSKYTLGAVATNALASPREVTMFGAGPTRTRRR